MNALYPVRSARWDILGSAALLAIRGTAALQRAGRTDHNVVCAADTHHKLCGDLGGKGGAPRDRTCENEPFVPISYDVRICNKPNVSIAPTPYCTDHPGSRG